MTATEEPTPTILGRLTKPFAPHVIHRNPSGGGDYVSHSVVVQKLLAVVGPFDFAIVELIRGDVPGSAPNPAGTSRRARDGVPALTNVVVGALCELTVQYEGRPVTIREVGDVEHPHNWPTDGARAKDAASDAIKRCAMRLGVGLHLWAGDEWLLDGHV